MLKSVLAALLGVMACSSVVVAYGLSSGVGDFFSYDPNGFTHTMNGKETNISITAGVAGATWTLMGVGTAYAQLKGSGYFFGYNVTVPVNALGTTIKNNLRNVTFIINSSYPLEATPTGFRYAVGSVVADRVNTTSYVVYDFHDVAESFATVMNVTDLDGKSVTVQVPLPYTVNVKGGSATVVFNFSSVKLLPGSVFVLDPTTTITNVSSYTPQVVANVTLEPFPLSHLTVNDTSLVSYFPFDIGETTVYDYSATNNDGTNKSGSPTWNASGKIGGGMTFHSPATNDYYSLTGARIIDNTSWTVSAWFAANGTVDAVIYSEGVPGSNNYIMYLQLTGSGANQRVEYLVRNTTTSITNSSNASKNLRDNNWHQTVLVQVNKSERRLYIDGAQWANDTTLLRQTLAPTSASIGVRRSLTTTGFMNGSIDELMIWNRSLSSAEVTSLYNSQFGKYYGPLATQRFDNVSIGQDGSLCRVNVTVNTTQTNGTSMQLRVWEWDVGGVNTANSSYQNVANGSNMTISFAVAMTTYNVSLDFNYSSNAYRSYSPVLSDKIIIASDCNVTGGLSCVDCTEGSFLCPCGCNITSNFDYADGTLTFNGSGSSEITGNLTNCRLKITGGCLVWLKANVTS